VVARIHMATDGAFDVWINDETTFSRHGDFRAHGPSMPWSNGIYCTRWDTETPAGPRALTIFRDNLRIATTFAEADPASWSDGDAPPATAARTRARAPPARTPPPMPADHQRRARVARARAAPARAAQRVAVAGAAVGAAARLPPAGAAALPVRAAAEPMASLPRQAPPRMGPAAGSVMAAAALAGSFVVAGVLVAILRRRAPRARRGRSST
jgi:hypothetical protein